LLNLAFASKNLLDGQYAVVIGSFCLLRTVTANY